MAGSPKSARGTEVSVTGPTIVVLGVGTALLLTTLLVDLPFQGPLFATATVAVLGALLALGASRAGRIQPRIVWIVAATCTLYAGSFALLFALAGDDVSWLGVPKQVWILLGGLLAAPLVLTSLGHGLTFDDEGLDPASLAALRARFGPAEPDEER